MQHRVRRSCLLAREAGCPSSGPRLGHPGYTGFSCVSTDPPPPRRWVQAGLLASAHAPSKMVFVVSVHRTESGQRREGGEGKSQRAVQELRWQQPDAPGQCRRRRVCANRLPLAPRLLLRFAGGAVNARDEAMGKRPPSGSPLSPSPAPFVQIPRFSPQQGG